MSPLDPGAFGRALESALWAGLAAGRSRLARGAYPAGAALGGFREVLHASSWSSARVDVAGDASPGPVAGPVRPRRDDHAGAAFRLWLLFDGRAQPAAQPRCRLRRWVRNDVQPRHGGAVGGADRAQGEPLRHGQHQLLARSGPRADRRHRYAAPQRRFERAAVRSGTGSAEPHRSTASRPSSRAGS